MKTLQILLVLLAGLTIAGCEDRYRYACQDPANWNSEQCQRPKCEASGTCPDQLLGRPVQEESAPAEEPAQKCEPTDQGEI